jgi:hypothetical protein
LAVGKITGDNGYNRRFSRCYGRWGVLLVCIVTGSTHIFRFTIISYTEKRNLRQQLHFGSAMKKKKMKMKGKMKPSKKSGPQGPVSRGSYDAVSPKNAGLKSFVLGTKTNKSPAIRGQSPAGKKSK